MPQNVLTWTCDWLDWFSIIIIFTDLINSLLQRYPEIEWVPVVFFSGRLPSALVWLGWELLSSSLSLWRYFVRVALYSAHWPTVWLPRLLSHWNCSQTVPLTLVLRIFASAELRLYRTSLPCLIILRTIWSEWTRSRWSPLAWSRMSLERIVGTCNLLATLVALSL